MKINNNLKEIIKTASNNIEIIQILALQDIFKSNRQRHKYLDTMFIGRYKPDFSTIQKAFPKKKEFEEFILSYKRKLPKKVFNEMPWDKYRELKINCYRYLPRKQKKCMQTYLAHLKQKKRFFMEDFDHLRDEWLDDPTFNALYFQKLFESKPSIYKDNFLEKITYKFFQRTKSDDLWKNASNCIQYHKRIKDTWCLSWQEEEEMQESILFKNFDLKVQKDKKFKKYFLNLYKDIPYQLILDQPEIFDSCDKEFLQSLSSTQQLTMARCITCLFHPKKRENFFGDIHPDNLEMVKKEMEEASAKFSPFTQALLEKYLKGWQSYKPAEDDYEIPDRCDIPF
tara:strand:+ start:2120 stop:3139 length:1020 start_codon:yes stop_codon:yes gene_type:complete